MSKLLKWAINAQITRGSCCKCSAQGQPKAAVMLWAPCVTAYRAICLPGQAAQGGCSSPAVRMCSPAVLKPRVPLSHEIMKGRSCVTQLMAWLCRIIPTAIYQMAEASKVRWMLQHHRPKTAQWLHYNHLPWPFWHVSKRNYAIHHMKRFWCGDHRL